MDNIWLGTSGWSYREWIGPFYKKKEKSMLSAYSKVFKTVEINSTFYRYPSKGMAMGWLKYSPTDFIFVAKLPKLITHEKKLRLVEGVEDDLKRFCELMEPLHLNGKLGCMLIQLPPRFNFNLDLMEDFFKILPTNIKFAVEFRDSSWMRDETWRLLKNYKVAYTIVDEPLLPPEVHVTSKIAYFRWHGRGTRPWYNYRYSIDELKPWVPKVKEVADKVETVYGYLNNHYHGYAVENCLQILEMLGTLTPKQAEAKATAERYLEIPTKVKTPTLEAFTKPKKMTFENLLDAFIDKPRLKRAQRIDDKELTIQEETDDQIRALIRDYHIVVDVGNRALQHDCADWIRMLLSKRFCKHIGKLLLSLDRQRATNILKQIYSDREKWEFKPFTE
ncbi:MAG: DUF72 domain-containing protein [Candidatus Bathyarchaeota archaeon]|nr:MAG: DUF72 domain-containing protein [Candidatus Bathyarchaeota archaeon]